MIQVLVLIKGLGRGGAEQLVVGAVQHGDASMFEYEVAYLLPRKRAMVDQLRAATVPTHCLRGDKGVGWVGRLRALVRNRGFDLVHVHSPYPAIGARLSVPKRTRVVYTEHNVWQRYHLATYWGNLLTYQRNDHVFAVSDEVRRSIRYPRPFRLLKMPPVETLYHGPDHATFPRTPQSDSVRQELGIPPEAPVVGTVANLKAHKGLEHLLQAAARVRRELPDARFVIVGQGPEEETLRRRARDLALDATVTFTGYRDDAIRMAATFDVFVLSSLYEGLSIALVEAMALGKPVVVTRVGGLPEVVENGKHGFVVPPANPSALASGILDVLRDSGLRERLGEAARKRAREFDIRNAVRRMESVYEVLLG